MSDSPRMTFGRYRGHSVRYVVDADRNYVFWAMGQPWFKRKHPAHYVECRRLLVKRLTAEIAEEERRREANARGWAGLKVLSMAELCHPGADLV